VTVIPAGSTSRWDIHQPMNIVQLYLPQATLERISGEAVKVAPRDLLERTAHPDPTTSRLLMSAADFLDGREPLDALFRQELTDLLATRLLAAHAGSSTTFQPAAGGLSPKGLRRAIERLRSDNDADVSLTALASDAGLSRFHFCHAFKKSTGLSPHAWLRQHQLEQAMKMLRDTDASVVSVAAALGYGSQTAFAAAFRKLTSETPATARTLTAISLQVRQLLWSSGTLGSLEVVVFTATTRRRATACTTLSAGSRTPRGGKYSRPRSCTRFR
jgi:AraC family transcriptional regulator